MARVLNIEPFVGDWYESRGERFEVVAVDDAEGTIEVQYADGTLAEMEVEDWALRAKSGALFVAEPPDALGGGIDADSDDEGHGYGSYGTPFDDDRSLRASGLDGLDLFE